MSRLIDRLLLLLKFLSVFGARGVPIAWKLYVGRRGKLVRVRLPGGHPVLVRKRSCDVAVFRTAFVEREYDAMVFPQGAALAARYQDILARGRKPLVIVCGANTGSSSIFFALQFPQATVVALEPSRDNFELLCRNAEFYQPILPIQAGIWDKKTWLKIMNPTDEPYKYRTVECPPDEPGAMATLGIGEVLERFPEGEALLADIDVEGAEFALFRDHVSWVTRIPLLIIELHDWLLPRQKTSSNLISVVAGLDCDVAIRGENLLVFNWAALLPPEALAATRCTDVAER